jgi:glyoxylase-like metal-dependent hydrolase (beta-lactamase superfamily II)
MVVEQANGVVVIEPGMNDLKGEEVINWISKRYPGKPVTHLVSSHHHNDHGGGIRPYVANGATLVVHKTATEFYKAQASRPISRVLMDALDRNPQPAKIVGVAAGDSYTIEDPTQSVTVYPVLGGHTEDMVVAVLEKQSMLYAGDLYVSGIARDLRSGTKRGPNVLPFHSAVALDETIRAYDLDVPILVGSHDRQPVTYQDLANYITD